MARPTAFLCHVLMKRTNRRMLVVSVNAYHKNTLLKRNMSLPCLCDKTSTISIVRYVFMKKGYGNPSNALMVPKLTEIVESPTPECVIYSKNAVGHRVHRLTGNIKQRCMEQFAVQVHKVNGHTLHVFVHDILLNVSALTVDDGIVAAVTLAAVSAVATNRLFILLHTSLGLFLDHLTSVIPRRSLLQLHLPPILRHRLGLIFPLQYRLYTQKLRIFCIPILIRRH